MSTVTVKISKNRDMNNVFVYGFDAEGNRTSKTVLRYTDGIAGGMSRAEKLFGAIVWSDERDEKGMKVGLVA